MNKRIVSYEKDRGAYPWGNVALLWPVNHPDTERVSNTKEAITSEVVSWDEKTGIIETQNTIYIPNDLKD